MGAAEAPVLRSIGWTREPRLEKQWGFAEPAAVPLLEPRPPGP